MRLNIWSLTSEQSFSIEYPKNYEKGCCILLIDRLGIKKRQQIHGGC